MCIRDRAVHFTPQTIQNLTLIGNQKQDLSNISKISQRLYTDINKTNSSTKTQKKLYSFHTKQQSQHYDFLQTMIMWQNTQK